MQTYTSGCLICGKSLEYFKLAKELKCEICGLSFESNTSCENQHFICDACHSKTAYKHITEIATTTKEKNPIAIAMNMMKIPFINMHGPEHHYLIVAALLAAFKNASGKIHLDESLKKARQRSKSVPGGICGMWGCCGAGIGAGIFTSIVTEATPLSVKEWGLSNLMTSESLLEISKNGGPRCCKRNTLLSVEKAIEFTDRYLNVRMEKPQKIKCPFFQSNPTCKKDACIYYPLKEATNK